MVALYLLAAVIAGVFVLQRLFPARAARICLDLDRRRAGLELKKGALPYLEGGSGSETIVLLHGFGADKDNYLRVAPLLAAHYRVLIPDLPGFGRASRNAEVGHSMSQQMENLRNFLRQLGLSRVHLGGSSMGGYIASEFAAHYPDEVASLWLLAPAGTKASFDLPLYAHYRATGKIPLLVPTPGHIGELLKLCMVKLPYIPYCMMQQFGRRAAADFPLHTQLLRDMLNSPRLEAQYQRIDTPALIVWGKQDRILNPAGAAATQALMPDSQVVLMENIGHLPMIEAPRKSADTYLAFLRGLRERHSVAAA